MMVVILNIGRILMVLWVGYALLLLFKPDYLRHAAAPMLAIGQALIAFVIGHLLDRALGAYRRREAQRGSPPAPIIDADQI
jgi:hypothetical protein